MDPVDGRTARLPRACLGNARLALRCRMGRAWPNDLASITESGIANPVGSQPRTPRSSRCSRTHVRRECIRKTEVVAPQRLAALAQMAEQRTRNPVFYRPVRRGFHAWNQATGGCDGTPPGEREALDRCRPGSTVPRICSIRAKSTGDPSWRRNDSACPTGLAGPGIGNLLHAQQLSNHHKENPPCVPQSQPCSLLAPSPSEA